MRITGIFYLLILLWCISCTKDIDYHIPEGDKVLVVDGYIEQGAHPYIILTEVTPFFSKYDSLEIRKLVVTSAKATVSDGDTTEILSLVKNAEFLPPYVYRGEELKGEVGKTYTLTVYWNGKVHEAKTTILPSIKLESLSFDPLFRHNDTLAIVHAKFNDPPGEPNYYRVFTKIEGKQEAFYPFYFSTFGDNLFDGQSFTFTVFKGLENFYDQQDNIYFDKNDTIVVKFCSIDKKSFRFWNSAEKEMALANNPISLSGRGVESNVSNGALGHWTGYSFTLDTILTNL